MNEQLQLPEFKGYEARDFKLSVTGTINRVTDQPANAGEIQPYEPVAGVFVGTLGHFGFDPTVTGQERTPTLTTKINVSQMLIPLSPATQKAWRELMADIYEENRLAALSVGRSDPEDADLKKSA